MQPQSLDRLRFAVDKCLSVSQIEVNRLERHCENLSNLVSLTTNQQQGDDDTNTAAELTKELTNLSRTLRQLETKLIDLSRLRKKLTALRDITDFDQLAWQLVRDIDTESSRLSELIQTVSVSNCGSSGLCHQLDQDINHVAGLLGELRREQGDNEDTQSLVAEEVKESVWSARLRLAALPVGGALIGSLIAGPVGFIVAAKMGAAAAMMGGGLIGLTSGGVVSRLRGKSRQATDSIELTEKEKIQSVPEGESTSSLL